MLSLLARQVSRTVGSVHPMMGTYPLRTFGASTVTPDQENDMFCMQCEQTQNGSGCTTVGVCGKTFDTAAEQDLLVYVLKGVGMYADRLAQEGVQPSRSVGEFTMRALFSTMTNVNFDKTRFKAYVMDALAMREGLKEQYEAVLGHRAEKLSGPAAWTPSENTIDYFVSAGKGVNVLKYWSDDSQKDVVGLQELALYGMKGMSAYANHARLLGSESDNVYGSLLKGLRILGDDERGLGNLLSLVDQVGETNLEVIKMLDEAHRDKLGNPEIGAVNRGAVEGKALLVSGHDMQDMLKILEQTEGKGINVYTHGEMLPAHSYPGLKKFKHLVGHYGGAWQKQKTEFAKFPGSIVMTTNCIIEPRDSYRDRIFTVGEVGYEGVEHIADHDFTPAIDSALQQDGFTEKHAAKKAKDPFTVGFGHTTVLSVADKILEAVQTGNLKHVFVVGGCDGSEGERSYYSDVGRASPDDSLILTLGCGKYRLLDEGLGNIQLTSDLALPRVLDMGQCNDAYGAVVVAQALAGALNTDINSLPLSINLSWFEQKAVAQLLTLLHLGVKKIALGPNLPAFITPTVLQALVDKYGIWPASAHDTEGAAKDMQTMLS